MVDSEAVSVREQEIQTGSTPAVEAPKPRARKRATYLFTIVVAGYPVHVFRAKLKNEIACFYTSTHEIFLHTSTASSAQAIDAVVHELLHAISEIALVEEMRLNEQQVQTLATLLIDVYLRNPVLQAFLYELLASGSPGPALPVVLESLPSS